MTDKARELLERIVGDINLYRDMSYEMIQEIRAYLAEPEVKRKALSKEELLKQWSVAFQYGHVDRATFIYGVRWAEKMHKIGDSNE